MGKLLAFVGATVGGYAGWALGATIGNGAAFVLSVVGPAVGVYPGRRSARQFGA